jgi:F-type H+-transporting ATPase subunit b
MSVATLALLAAAEGGGGLTDINWTLNVATLVLFMIFAIVLGRFAWKPLLGMIEEREKSVREHVAGAEKASAEAAQLLEKHKELVRDAMRERDEALKRAAQDAEKLRADLQARARAESEQILQKARAQIERDKDQAIRDLRSQVADLAVEAASRIVTSSMTPEAQKKLVKEFIEGLPKSPS